MAILLTACANTDFVAGDSSSDAAVDVVEDYEPFADWPDIGPIPDRGRCEEVIDLVFALDLSSSMSFVLNTLRAEVGKVVSASNALKEGAHFGLVLFVDNTHLDTTGADEGGKVHVEAATLQAAFDHYKSVYTDHNRNPGDGPNGPTLQNPICEEASLDALYVAATEFPWRKTATRIIIVATDDTFLERPDNYGDANGDGKFDQFFPFREGDYPAKQTIVDTVGELKKNHIRVVSFARSSPDNSTCGTGRRLSWGAVSNGWTTPYGGNKPIPEQTGGKSFDLVEVRDKIRSLADTINDVVLDAHCRPIL